MDDRPEPAAYPQAGPPPPSDAELITLAGAPSFLPGQPACNRRLRAAGPLIRRAIRWLLSA